MPLGVSVARDPLAAVWRGRQSSATLQFASVDSGPTPSAASACGGLGLCAAGPGGMGYGQVARIRASSTATRLLRELGYKSEVVSHL